MKKVISLLLTLGLIFTVLAAPVYAEDNVYGIMDGSVRLLGRGEVSDNGARTFNWPNAGIEFTFTGTKAEVYVDTIKALGAPYDDVYFNISIDGGEPTRVALTSGWNVLYNGANGTRTVRFVRSSEACRGTCAFSKVRITGTRISPTDKKDRFIEFLGDSYTSGYGNSPELSESKYYCAQNTDNWYSFPGVVARNFDADFTSISYQGKGVLYNVDGSTENTMSQQFLYNDIVTDGSGASCNMSKKTLYMFEKATPDVLVLFLGTNDASGIGGNAAKTAEFKVAYKNLLNTIRSKYPATHIIAVSKSQNGCMLNEISEVVTEVQKTDKNLHRLILQNFSASSFGHPNKTEDAAIANEIIAKINTIPNVWDVPDAAEGTDKISVYADYNTNTITIAGNTGFADDMVSGVITYPNTELQNAQGKNEIAYLDQTVTDSGGDYRFVFNVPAATGVFGFYMNSYSTDIRNNKSFTFKSIVPTMKLTKKAAGTEVKRMSDLAVGDDILLTVSGFDNAAELEGIIILAQYDSNGVLKEAEAKRATGSNTNYGEQVEVEASVGASTAKIKMFYMEMQNLRPLTGVYSIE